MPGDQLTPQRISLWLALPRHVAWSRYDRLLVYWLWLNERIASAAIVMLFSGAGVILLSILVGVSGSQALHGGIDLLWLAGALCVVGFLVMILSTALAQVCHLLSLPGWIRTRPGQRPPPDLFVEADSRGLRIGAFWRRRIAWWQIERVTKLGSEWTIAWAGGQVVILADEPRNAGLRRALTGVTRARARGVLLPGQPSSDQVPANALSLAQHDVDDDDLDLGLSRAEMGTGTVSSE